ncbi:MAG: glycosyl transferase, partial [Clostridium sp.]|nr:glycosyl transferase [Clostridium sp.]
DQMACARLIDWERGNPYVFRMADYDEIMQSPAMFARKFSMQTDPEIVRAIMDELQRDMNR